MQAIERELETLRYNVLGGGKVDAETMAAETAQREDEFHALVPGGGSSQADVAANETPHVAIVSEVPVTIVAAPSEEAKPEPDVRIVPKTGDPLAGIRDEVDPQVLEIFLEEAAELYPQAGDQVRAWRRQP